MVVAVRLSAAVRSGVVLLLGPVAPFVAADFLGVVDISKIEESDCSRRRSIDVGMYVVVR